MAEPLRFRVLRQAQDERVLGQTTLKLKTIPARAELVEARLATFAVEGA